MTLHPDQAVHSDPGDVAGITLPYRVRFDECGPDALVRSSALLRYAQDIAWAHSERMGFDRAWYAERGLAWVVRAAELVILAPVGLGETIDMSTAVTGFRRVWARRRTEGRLADGSLVFWGHTDWVMTDTARGLPGRVPVEFPAAFVVPPGSFEPGRVALPPTPPGAVGHDSVVRPQDLDPMGHVNNAVYVDYLEETLGQAAGVTAPVMVGSPRRIRIEYLVPAAAGARLRSEAWPLAIDAGEPGWAWRLTDGHGHELARALVTASA